MLVIRQAMEISNHANIHKEGNLEACNRGVCIDWHLNLVTPRIPIPISVILKSFNITELRCSQILKLIHKD